MVFKARYTNPPSPLLLPCVTTGSSTQHMMSHELACRKPIALQPPPPAGRQLMANAVSSFIWPLFLSGSWPRWPRYAERQRTGAASSFSRRGEVRWLVSVEQNGRSDLVPPWWMWNSMGTYRQRALNRTHAPVQTSRLALSNRQLLHARAAPGIQSLADNVYCCEGRRLACEFRSNSGRRMSWHNARRLGSSRGRARWPQCPSRSQRNLG
ncbi:hypothetical protein GQ53DRAFT_85860 [Thozetella sp. PMI_491]|nr:hypothetical protein GQ53DRAFT_85860 [Thozetella sp. PMI_491]